MRKKALIFNPYLDILGGGEFYSLLIAEFFLKKKFQVEIAWPEKEILKKIKERFGLDFKKKVKINHQAFYILKKRGNFIEKYLLTKSYQLIFFISDGSIPLLFGEKNWLLFQAPFTQIQGKSILNQWKLKRINQVICYSSFVKKFIDREFKVNSQVVYPSLAKKFFNLKPIKKENIILSVGRFDEKLNAKKQDILIKVFKQMIDQGLKSWRLILLGGLMTENEYFKKLKQAAEGYPIKIMANVDFKTIISYYQKAKIYWHAAGYGEDLRKDPRKAEHFGLVIAEAMICRTVPLVFKAGGPIEIIGSNMDNLGWLSQEELIKKTGLLIKKPELREKLARQLRKRALHFNQGKFFNNLTGLLN
jgi:glycosyltransferase involved in cell wall biosynthesis